MKSALVAFAFVLVSTAASASQVGIRPTFSSPEGFTSVSCRDARPLADAGIQVQITQHQGRQILELSEETFAGPRALGMVQVQQVFTQERGNHAMYVGQNVQLVIDLDSGSRPDLLRMGEMEGFIRGVVNTVKLDHDLRCRFFARTM